MKKTLLTLCILMLFSLTACGGGATDEASEPAEDSIVTSDVSTSEADAETSEADTEETANANAPQDIDVKPGDTLTVGDVLTLTIPEGDWTVQRMPGDLYTIYNKKPDESVTAETPYIFVSKSFSMSGSGDLDPQARRDVYSENHDPLIEMNFSGRDWFGYEEPLSYDETLDERTMYTVFPEEAVEICVQTQVGMWDNPEIKAIMDSFEYK